MEDNTIEFLRKQFLCCTPLKHFKWPDSMNNIDVDVQIKIINATVRDELVLMYPIKQSYKKAFLKLFIKKLEQNEIEIDADIYNTYCNIVASTDEEAILHYRHFLLNNEGNSHCISIKESMNIMSQGTTGLCSWKAAFYLAEWCIANKQELEGKKILELGSGVGLTGLTIINFCTPREYYFSDGNPIVLKTLEENVHLNLLMYKKELWKKTFVNNKIQLETKDSKMKISLIHLKWEDISKLHATQIDVDLIIAADILYDKNTFEVLVQGLKIFMSKSVKYTLIAAIIRSEKTMLEFLDILSKYDFLYVKEIAYIPQIFIRYEETPATILKILPK